MTLSSPAFPPAPPGRTGWPWTDAGQPKSDGSLSVTVVTPSFNQAAFLEATIRSVLLQNYAALEYLVIDGGSTDGSRDIIARYAPFVDFAVSEPDRGQAHAINKGFERATGDIVAWLNSDDYYTEGAVARVVSEFEADPTLQWVYGDCIRITEPSGVSSPCPSEPFEYQTALRGYSPICQPSAFFRRSLLDQTGPLDETFKLALDYDLWLRAIKHTRPRYLAGTVLAVVADHAEAKSRRQLGEVVFESTRAIERFFTGTGVPPEVMARQRSVLGHLYLECAAAAVLWRKSLLQAIRWFVRAAAQDPRVLAELPALLGQTAVFVLRDRMVFNTRRRAPSS
jgi:glycosyltransferase involved in cell wall biosynthesis